ncbi:hypothetical protein P152DRAFT_93645 [Eremomyces bilateralis CBS 781.70]|uniref:Uncharacterized protein n=1 Tax=Eremomyces bilateralis CBS 781.70 TaxID=1392243 RepID=A0A6G1FYE7_9PEZI|nr:uncharacterized protein P152DRAFT_93645 [Eremomyces bilateralis CBS 781.70]KAF1810696.1 hypothetical protein P152DRAFT_93645 [Eremomyces bilateralis CBS 781.70]
MSELSTVAIKDGHRGHLPHHASQPGSSAPLDAERADRISRLAGLERISQQPARPPTGSLAPSNTSLSVQAGSPAQFPAATHPSGAGAGHPHAGPGAGHHATVAFFSSAGEPTMVRDRSTVGSASATGSVGGRTTWASGSDVGMDDGATATTDRVSEDGGVQMRDEEDLEHENEGEGKSLMGETASSVGDYGGDDRFSDGGSLVAFGEGARTPARAASGVGSPVVGKAAVVPVHLRETGQSALGREVAAGSERNEARLIDGMTYDANVVDTADRTPPVVGPGAEGRRGMTTTQRAEREIKERRERGEMEE